MKLLSSIHWVISLSFLSFSYNGVCFDKLKLSVSDIIVTQKGSNGEGKLHFFGQDSYFTFSLLAKIHPMMISSKYTMKNEFKETYSTVRIWHKTKSKYPNGDYFPKSKTVGIWYLDTYIFWMVKSRLVGKLSVFFIKSEIPQQMQIISCLMRSILWISLFTCI